MKKPKKSLSLQTKYMLIIFTAISIVYTLGLGATLFTFSIFSKEGPETLEIEEAWHKDARFIENASLEDVQILFNKWKKTYPEAGMFWINQHGELILEENLKNVVPAHWDANYTATFIKERYNQNPFTVIAFVGEEAKNGFIVFEIDRELLQPEFSEKNTKVIFLVVLTGIFLFILFSFLFFRGIRKRLLYLQEAMEIRDVDGLPIEITVKKFDEIGQLEHSFNRMVEELRISKKREEEEEQLRKELIANLSHDLRTPLTKIRAHAYNIPKEELSNHSKNSLNEIEKSISKMEQLIGNLMDYTLLNAKKLKYNPVKTDIVRLTRSLIAAWYPVFEKEGFIIEVNLESFREKDWLIDPLWFERIIDNLFQNVQRHAKDGKYIKIATESVKDYDAILIEDKGGGFKQKPNEKGAGIGLTIVDMMIKSMELEWEIQSTNTGTLVKIKKIQS